MKTTKVKSHLRKGKMVKAHTRKSQWDKDMAIYYSTESLKKPKKEKLLKMSSSALHRNRKRYPGMFDDSEYYPKGYTHK